MWSSLGFIKTKEETHVKETEKILPRWNEYISEVRVYRTENSICKKQEVMGTGEIL